MRLVPARTAVRTTAIAATMSLAIGLLSALAPAGEASATRPVASPAAEVMTGVMKALSGALLAGLKLPPVIRWQLSRLRPGSHVPVADRASAGTGSIAGTVTGDGRPLGRICVLAVPADGPFAAGSTITAKSGRYKLSGLKPGRYRVTFATFVRTCQHRDSWLEQWYRGVDSADPTHKTVTVPVRAGKVTRGINARLHHGAEITGIIRDTSGNPLSGICAITVGISGDSVVSVEAISGENGRYTLGGLFPGKYEATFLDCRARGNYAFQVWRHAKSLDSATMIKVVGKRPVTGIDPVMLPGATVVGTVRGGSTRGKPVRGVCIEIDGGNGNDFSSIAITGKAGGFAIKKFGSGRYMLDIDPSCTGTSATPYLETDRTFKATGGHVSHEGIVPLRVGARLTGVVRDSGGHPLPGVCVTVEDDEFNPFMARTGSNGAYTLAGIRPGKFAVGFTGCATASSVRTQFYNDKPTENSADKVTFRAGKTVSGIDATMQSASTLTGLVTAGRISTGINAIRTTCPLQSCLVRSWIRSY